MTQGIIQTKPISKIHIVENVRVKMMVLLGELGGEEEYKIAKALMQKRITKPLVAWCIGTCADCITSEVQFGHAGASANAALETAAAKNAALKAAGAYVPESFDDFGIMISKVYQDLVKNGTILPQTEEPPPPVPMDYNWAKVIIIDCKGIPPLLTST